MEAYGKSHRRPTKSWSRRRRALHHELHSDDDSGEEDTPESTSEEEEEPLHKVRPRTEKCSCLDCQRPHFLPKYSASRPYSSHFDHLEVPWWSAERHDDRHAWPNRRVPYPESRHHLDSDEDESLDEHTDTDESMPRRASEHKMFTSTGLPAQPHGYSMRPYDDDDNDDDDPEIWPEQPRRRSQRKMYYTPRSRSRPTRSKHAPFLPEANDEVRNKTLRPPTQTRSRDHSPHDSKGARHKSSRHFSRMPGAFSDEDSYGMKKLSIRPFQSDEHHGPGSKTVKSEHSGEYAPHHLRAPSPPQIIRQRSNRQNTKKPSEGPFSAPKLRNPVTADGDNAQRSRYNDLPTRASRSSFATPRSTEDHLVDLRARRERQYGRPGIFPRSVSDNLLTRSSTAHLSDGRSRLGKTRAGQKISEVTTSLSSSISGGLGSKTFSYAPLENKMDFRLTRILPGKTAKLKCEIIHASFDHPPEYIAISYAWGDGFDTKRLVLGDSAISITASLHGALKAVRDKEDEVLVWADGLCIDQNNKDERAVQVTLMNYIYSRAKFVAVWLGSHADDSQFAMPLLEEVVKGKVANKRIRATNNPDSAALQSLFKRGYWNRLWAVQEIFLAQEIWVYCGSSQLPWDAYEAASDAFWEHESDPNLCEGPSSFPNVDSLVALGPNSLLELLRACRKKLSNDPRDKVFGILGMVPKEIRKHMVVNYNQPVKSLYIDVVDQIVSSTRRLDVIRESIHFPLHSSSADLPSWCPEWSQMPELSALREQSFAAAGETDAEFEFHDNERKLEFAAVELGVVDVIGVAVGTLCALQDYLMAFLHWRALLLDTTNIDEQGENIVLLEAFCRTLSLGQVPQQWERKGWMGACYHAFSSLIQKRMPRLPIDTVLQQHANTALIQSSELRSFVQKHFGDRMMGRTFCITKNGLMGMGSGFMGKGDVVVVPFGCSTPILLRAEGVRGEYRYVGDIYIHGFMHGEALSGDKPIKQYMLH